MSTNTAMQAVIKYFKQVVEAQAPIVTPAGTFTETWTLIEPTREEDVAILAAGGYELLAGFEDDGTTTVGVAGPHGRLYRPREHDFLTVDPNTDPAVLAGSKAREGVQVLARVALGVENDEKVESLHDQEPTNAEVAESVQVILSKYDEVADYLRVDKSELTMGKVFETLPEMRKAKEV